MSQRSRSDKPQWLCSWQPADVWLCIAQQGSAGRGASLRTACSWNFFWIVEARRLGCFGGFNWPGARPNLAFIGHLATGFLLFWGFLAICTHDMASGHWILIVLRFPSHLHAWHSPAQQKLLYGLMTTHPHTCLFMTLMKFVGCLPCFTMVYLLLGVYLSIFTSTLSCTILGNKHVRRHCGTPALTTSIRRGGPEQRTWGTYPACQWLKDLL